MDLWCTHDKGEAYEWEQLKLKAKKINNWSLKAHKTLKKKQRKTYSKV